MVICGYWPAGRPKSLEELCEVALFDVYRQHHRPTNVHARRAGVAMPKRNDRKRDERLVQRDRRRRHSLKSRSRSELPTFSQCSIFLFSRSNVLIENKSSL